MEQIEFIGIFLFVLFLLLGTGVRARRSRKRFIWEGAAFRCRFRNCGYSSTAWPRLRRRWSRVSSSAA